MIEYGVLMENSYSFLMVVISITILLGFVIYINYQSFKIKKEIDLIDEKLDNNEEEELDYDKNQNKEC